MFEFLQYISDLMKANAVRMHRQKHKGMVGPTHPLALTRTCLTFPSSSVHLLLTPTALTMG